jgi:DNA helicase-2/ATP-dependent DNA helicase PcrA
MSSDSGSQQTNLGLSVGADPSTSPQVAAARSLIEGLNTEQAAAVLSDAPMLRILAGAGSGKTRVLTHRIAYHSRVGTIDPRAVLAVTFTRKAAHQLRQRLGHLGLRDAITAGTFHSIAFAQLRARWAERGIRPPELLERKAAFVGRLIRSRDLAHTLDVVAEIEWAAARAVEPEHYAAQAAPARRDTPLASYDAMANLIAQYRTTKLDRRVVDFDDVLRLAARDLNADPAYAEARRWRHRYLFVDEFQDVNPLQFSLLRAWLGPESWVCIVGDPRQAIYGWNGADSTYLNEFGRYFEGSDTVELLSNYRSSPQILAIANEVLKQGGVKSAALRPHRGDGPIPEIRKHPSDVEEGRAIARALRDAHGPNQRWSSQAVLVRTHAQTAAIAEALTGASIPHRTRSEGNFLKQPEITAALADLRRAANFGSFVGDLDRSIEAQRGGRPTEAADAEDVWHQSGGPNDNQASEPLADSGMTDAEAPVERQMSSTSKLSARRVDNLVELSRLAHEFAALDQDATAAAFQQWLTVTVGTESNAAGEDGVDIVSFHAAKGLEWPVVHIAGCEVGLTPIHHADTPAAIAEERRLMYVAITRAERSLTFHHAATRTFGNRSMRRDRSEYLDAVESIADIMAGIDRPVSRPPERAKKERTRSRGSRPPAELDEADVALFEALQKWRLGASKAANVPAFVIFADKVLIDIATRRPRNERELLAVSGIGATKADRFGYAIINLVQENPRTTG